MKRGRKEESKGYGVAGYEDTLSSSPVKYQNKVQLSDV